MPRGPGKKENYNLDYSRFNAFDRDEDADRRGASSHEVPSDDSPIPMAEILQNVPPELREAYRLMMESKQSGDEAAQRRANELVLAAVEKGGPEVRKKFLEEVSRQMPEHGQALRNSMPSAGGTQGAPQGVSMNESAEEMKGRLDHLRKKMEADAEAARKQLDGLTKQQEQLESLQSPEDLMKFMHEQGMSQEDLQRMFAGDQQHMENCCQGMLDRATALPESERARDPEATLQAAEELHAHLCEAAGGAAPPEPRGRKEAGGKEPAVPKPAKVALVPKPVEEPVKIAEHRLQYQKDAEGRYIGVELRVELPGVADMSSIMLDISEKYLRLTTCAPGPKYAVNAGPFPVLIEASQARAKYSKKRAELSVSVPAKPDM